MLKVSFLRYVFLGLSFSMVAHGKVLPPANGPLYDSIAYREVYRAKRLIHLRYAVAELTDTDWLQCSANAIRDPASQGLNSVRKLESNFWWARPLKELKRLGGWGYSVHEGRTHLVNSGSTTPQELSLSGYITPSILGNDKRVQLDARFVGKYLGRNLDMTGFLVVRPGESAIFRALEQSSGSRKSCLVVFVTPNVAAYDFELKRF